MYDPSNFNTNLARAGQAVDVLRQSADDNILIELGLKIGPLFEEMFKLIDAAADQLLIGDE